MWFFAPPSACTRLPFAAAVRYTSRATGAEPTNEMARTSGCAISASTASFAPCTTLSTPSGNPASRKSSARRNPPRGVRSDGFSTYVFPATTASGNIQSGIITGKLKGGMPAHTPSG